MKNFAFILTLTGLFTCFTNAANAQTHVVEETTFYYFDELDYAFYQCYNAFLSGHNGWAGARLKKAAHFVKVEAQSAKAHNKKPIMNQAKALEALATELGSGKVQSSWRLRRAFAHTHNVLANDYKLRAAELWAINKTKQTGYAMMAAAGHVGHAAKWAGEKVEGGFVNTGKAIATTSKKTGKAAKDAGKAVGNASKVAAVESARGVRIVASKMIEGVAFVPEKVGQGLEWLGKSINKVGEKVAPAPRNQ